MKQINVKDTIYDIILQLSDTLTEDEGQTYSISMVINILVDTYQSYGNLLSEFNYIRSQYADSREILKQETDNKIDAIIQETQLKISTIEKVHALKLRRLDLKEVNDKRETAKIIERIKQDHMTEIERIRNEYEISQEFFKTLISTMVEQKESKQLPVTPQIIEIRTQMNQQPMMYAPPSQNMLSFPPTRPPPPPYVQQLVEAEEVPELDIEDLELDGETKGDYMKETRAIFDGHIRKPSEIINITKPEHINAKIKEIKKRNIPKLVKTSHIVQLIKSNQDVSKFKKGKVL